MRFLFMVLVVVASMEIIFNNSEEENEDNDTYKSVEVIDESKKDDVVETVIENKQDNDKLTELSLSDIKKKIDNKEDFVLIVLNAYCSHCKRFEPVAVEALEEMNGSIFKFDTVTLKTEEYRLFNECLNVSGTPTTVAFKSGKEVSRLVGEKDKEEFKNWVKEYL